jgi:hypothetical protein
MVDTVDEEEEAAEENAAEMDKRYGPRSVQHNLRPQKLRNYGHMHATLASITMTQHSVNKGLKVFGEAGVTAVLSELQQLHDRKVLKRKGDELMRKQKSDALPYLMFLKPKRCVRIKGQGCADGRKQREYILKDKISAPTVAIKSVMISCTIEAHEQRDVAPGDIPGAFMQTDMEDTVHMVLEGEMTELLVKIDLKLYRKYLLAEKGKSVIYVKLKKALYGTLQNRLLFWKKLSKKLVEWRFEINP